MEVDAASTMGSVPVCVSRADTSFVAIATSTSSYLVPNVSRIAVLQFIAVHRSIDAAAKSAFGDRKLMPDRCASSVVYVKREAGSRRLVSNSKMADVHIYTAASHNVLCKVSVDLWWRTDS